MVDTLIIKPVSTSCNLDCDYCYHGCLEKGGGSEKINRMSPLILRKVIKGFSELHQTVNKFLWHGGEPMLAGLDFFKEAASFQEEYFLDGRRYTNSIQTNGTVMNENIGSFLKERNFSIGVSLDGPGYIHDVHRKDRKSNGSFNRVMETIGFLKNNGVSVGIVCVVTRDSVQYPEELLNFFTENNLFRINFSPAVDFTANHILTDYSVTPREWKDFILRLFDAWIESDNKNTRIRLFDDLLRTYSGGKPRLCLLSRRCSNFLSVDYNGDVYVCGRFLKNNEFYIGNIEESSFEYLLSSNKYKDVKMKIEELPDNCLDCEWLNVCNGGCASYRFIDGVNRNHPYFCESMRVILPHMRDVLDRYNFHPSATWSLGISH